MNAFDIVCLLTAIASVLLSSGFAIRNRRTTRKTMVKMDRMLDMAINGSFTENTCDESALSRLEARLHRYLSESAVNARELRTEKERIKQLISDISHQTKTPVANLLLYSQLLEEQELTEEGRACAKALSSQAEKLNFLIGALVKTSRLEAGIIRASPEKEPVQTLFDSVMVEIGPMAARKRICLTVRNTGAVACYDLKWTAEALYNVVDNAVKYTPEGRSITISAIPYEMFCRIDVADEGIGIAEEEQNRIFARFYRSSAVARQEGVGIGLFLAREILSAQGGYIKVKSRLGEGSIFSLFLPVTAQFFQNR